MNYYNLCGIGPQHRNISKGNRGGGCTYKNHWYARLQSRWTEIKMWHWIYVLKVVMNKKNPEQISSGSFNYLLNLGRGVVKQCFD
jgi:hypothetical protein